MTFPPTFRCSAIFVFSVCSWTHAQSDGGFAIRKSTFAGGGVTFHSGGTYRLGGTVGQHDSGRLSGGNYLISGGFWTPGMMVDVPPTPIPDMTGFAKSRFISLSIPSVGFPIAIRVKLLSLHHVSPPYTGGVSQPFTAFEGEARWVGPPKSYNESTEAGASFRASFLQCTPHYQEWGTVGLLHVTGSAIVPSSVYAAEMLANACAGVETTPQCSSGGSLVSTPLQIGTTRWGDVETPYNPPSATIQPDLADVSALVNKFRNAPGAPIKARALLIGIDAAGTVDIATEFSFIHIAGCLDAFRGRPYPHTIQACP